jgi:hypothetical protein
MDLRFNYMPWIVWNPEYDPLREDPPFKTLARVLKLPG